jgi:hypothetical protein
VREFAVGYREGLQVWSRALIGPLEARVPTRFALGTCRAKAGACSRKKMRHVPTEELVDPRKCEKYSIVFINPWRNSTWGVQVLADT